jgi:hypothetical protein
VKKIFAHFILCRKRRNACGWSNNFTFIP